MPTESKVIFYESNFHFLGISSVAEVTFADRYRIVFAVKGSEFICTLQSSNSPDNWFNLDRNTMSNLEHPPMMFFNLNGVDYSIKFRNIDSKILCTFTHNFYDQKPEETEALVLMSEFEFNSIKARLKKMKRITK